MLLSCLQVNAALEQLQQYLAEDNDEPDQEALNCLVRSIAHTCNVSVTRLSCLQYSIV